VFLRSLTLRDWKAFETVRFEFPRPEPNRNVVLIGGKNGYGKTSLFEAIALGLFGRDGIRLVTRSAPAVNETQLRKAYHDFLTKALNGKALGQGRTSCRVELVFEDERGERIELERCWHFMPDGKPKIGENGEEILIRKGVGRTPVRPPSDEPDPEGWIRDWIARTFLPVTQAAFFLYDGEAASIYAERDMGVQVREGIDGLLGLVWLRQLAKDLRDYAKQRGREVPSDATTEALRQLETEIEKREHDLEQSKGRLNEVISQLAERELLRDRAARELSGYGAGTVAQLQELITQRATYQKDYDTERDKLFRIAEKDLPLALVGQSLLDRVRERLQKERRREQWEAAAAETEKRVATVLQALEDDLRSIQPPLSPDQLRAVLDALASGLQRLWHPPPADAAETKRHLHLLGKQEQVLSRIETVRALVREKIAEPVHKMAELARQIQRLDDAIQRSEITAPNLEKKRSDLNHFIQACDALNREKILLENTIRSLENELDQMRKEVARRRASIDQSARPARLAKRAEEIAAMLEDMLADAWKMQRKQVAEAMTKAIRAMAHRSDLLNRVEITDNGEVLLLSPEGTNLRDFDLSAGEKQIFTQALFSAVASVTNCQFPLIIDTPLGRLDFEHRQNILKYIVKRNSQVILMSTDTEIVGPYLEIIRSRVQKTYRLENRTDGSFGKSWAVEGYFPGQGFDIGDA
jgi:DNA sulfur modification protein DndD